MKIHHALLAASALIATCRSIPSNAQEKDNSTSTESLRANDGRPLATVLQTLEQKHGLAITYEDPVYAYGPDLCDVTESVAKRPINHRILVPKGGAFQFQYAVKDGHSQEDTITLLRRMVAEYAAASYQVFDVQERSTKRGTEWHVVPVMARDKAGNFAQQTVLLDNLITIPKEKRTAMAVVDEVCRQLSIAWGHKVGVGMVPLNPLYAHQVEFGATNQPARDVLADILGPRMVWQLFYDAGLDWYMLNIHTASLPPPRPPLPSRVYSAGPSAQGSSVSAIPSSPGPRFPTALLIKYKLTPERITEIQAALARRGYYQGQPNGTWDANTIAALQKFQTDNGLEPNGRPRPETLEKLGIGPAPPLFPPKN